MIASWNFWAHCGQIRAELCLFAETMHMISQKKCSQNLLNFLLTVNPANICLHEDVMKTSWRCLLSSSSEDVLIEINIILFVTRLQDVFKTSFQDVFKTPSRRLQDVLQKRLQDIFKKSSRRFEDILKTSWRHLQDVFKTSSKLI